MENNGTAVLLNQKAPNGGELVLIIDFQLKLLSLIELQKAGTLSVRDVLKDYTKKKALLSRFAIKNKSN